MEGEAKRGAGTIGKLAVDLGANAVQMALDRLAGPLSMFPMVVRSFGGAAQAARAEGKSYQEQVGLGLASAVTEWGTEKLFGGNPVYDTDAGLVNKIISNAVNKISPDAAEAIMTVLSSTAAETLNEGWEEVLSGLAEPLWKMIISGEAYEVDAQELLEDWIVGVLLGVVGQGTEAGMQAAAQAMAGQLFVDGDTLDSDTVQAMLTDAEQGQKAQAEQAETRRIYEALGLELPEAENAAPEGTAESIRAGRVTVIQHPYHGEIPVQNEVPQVEVPVPDASVQRASALIDSAENSAAQGLGGFKTILTRLYQQIFQRSSGIPVEGLTFQGKPYLVEIGNKVPGKVISDPNLSAEKLALLDILPQVVNHAEFVGSGMFIEDGKKPRPVVRYDYFEMPVKISGRGYIAKFDVEVLPFTNNYRTHQIVNVDLSSPGGSLVGPAPTASPGKSNPRNINIARQASAVNRSVGDSSDSDLNGEMSLSEIFPKQEENYYAVFGLENPAQVQEVTEAEKVWTGKQKHDIISSSDQPVEFQSGARKTEGWEDRHAERYYEEIRRRKPYSDADRISRNVPDLSREDIERIRRHVFIEEHFRDGRMARFDTDYDIAAAWQRLTEGKNMRDSDIIMLKHELLELQIMEQTGCSYEEAHEQANNTFNWQRLIRKD